MKRIFVIFAVIIGLVFSACGSSFSGDRKPAVETEEVTPPPAPPPAPVPATVPKDETFLATAFYLGEYTLEKGKNDESVGEMDPHTWEQASFQMDVVVNGMTKNIPMTADDTWFHKEGKKDPGRTEELKRLYEKMKTMPASRIQVVLSSDGKIKEAFLLPDYKEGKDGMAGTIVSPKIQIFPNLMAM